MPGIHPAILFIVIKNIILFLAFYFGGASLNFLLWWSVRYRGFLRPRGAQHCPPHRTEVRR